MNLRKIPLILIVQILLVITLLLYLPLRAKGAPVFLFWPIFWAVIIVSCLIILKSEKNHKIASLVILEVCLSMIILVSTPDIFQTNRDTYFESQYASEIAEKGVWNPKFGIGFSEDYYGYNPLIHFILSFLSLTTGLTTYFISKYIMFIFLRVILVLLVLLLISEFIKKDKGRIVYLATFIFISSFGMAFIEVSRRFIAGIFMILSFYAIIKSNSDSSKKVWDFLFYLFSPMVIIGNHSISYLFLVILMGIWLFGILAKTKIFNIIFNNKKDMGTYPRVFLKFVYFFVIFYLWQIFVSSILLKNDISYILEIKELIFGGYGPGLFLTVKGARPETFLYRFYETATIYLYHIMFFIMGLVGSVLFFIRLSLKNKLENKIKNKTLLLLIGFISLISYVLLFTLMRTTLDSASYTFLWFFCIPLSIFIAYSIDRIYEKTKQKKTCMAFILLISVLFYTGHMMSGIYTPRITNRSPDDDVVLGMDIRSQTPEIYYSAKWLYENADNQSKILGDINVFEIYSGMFGFDVSTDEYAQGIIYKGNADELNSILSSKTIYFGSYNHTYHYSQINYLVINQRFFNEKNYPFGNPVPKSNFKKLNQADSIIKIYDNKEISIYKNLLSENP
ncbi:MAG: hypothetical protein PHV16_02525 [Candidatus Nanoarchaeia archaeon]|nr:hypothetical protein [Candidatus Nanoarchaeia archaeon]